ncbi:uncharacterized protein LOC131954933 [Physella acuta]|uniref:uncharacterized protein LOC131954933 n=1 Tax=Physella acuta TaxID=109671 RepID=UPI0027DAF27A|nr:uncharacterized protein LOC131954933 [Physella acuta]
MNRDTGSRGAMNDSQSNSTVLEVESYTPLIDPWFLECFLVFNMVVCVAAGILGIFGNVVNVIIFYRQGYQDSVNVTLTSLAVTDTGALLSLQVLNIMINPWFLSSGIPVDAQGFSLMVSVYPHNYFIRVCGFITAFASFERCICVVSPLRVKSIITNKTTIITITLICVITTLDLIPPYYISYLGWAFIPAQNRSILTAIYRQNPYTVFSISYIMTDLVAPYATFFIIILSTSIITVKLRSQAKWRQSLVKSSTNISTKEKKTVVMLSTISIVFVICLLPQSAILAAISFVPELSYGGRHFDVSTLCYCISYMFETILSSVNTLVYFKMSQKYREQFILIFKLK